jgi:hypothetical protein
MLHLQRTSKVLIRFVLLLLIVQFVTPAFAPVATPDANNNQKLSLTSHHDSAISLAVFLKENSEEKSEEDEKPVFTAELIDFSFLTEVLTQSHSRGHWELGNQRLITQPLFKIHCIYII